MKRQKQHENNSSSNKKRNKNMLRRGLSISLAGIFFALLFIAPPVFAAATPKKTDNAGKPDVKSVAYSIPQGYRYNPAVGPDPFLPYFIKRDEIIRNLEEQRRKEVDAINKLRSMQEVRTELQKFDITQLTLSSIISGKDGIWAMVIDPTGTGHVIKKDSLIGKNGGVVDQIIRKVERTEYGSRYIRKVIIKEPYISKEGNIEYRFTEKDLVNPYYD